MFKFILFEINIFTTINGSTIFRNLEITLSTFKKLLSINNFLSSFNLSDIFIHIIDVCSRLTLIALNILFKSSKQLPENGKRFFFEINVGKIGPNVKYLDAGSMELAKSCYENLRNHDIIGIERHGSLSKGPDIEKIFEELETLEYYLDSYLKSPNRFFE